MRSKHSVRVLSVLLALVMVLALLPTSVFAAGEKSDDIVVLYTNDVHCGVDAGTPEGTMGYANLAAYKKAMEEAHNYVTLMDAGDAIQGEAIGTLSNGSYLVDIMNYLGYDYATFGNHEFDYGMDVALSLLEEADATYLSCNFTDLQTGQTVAQPYAMETYGDLQVAYVGISTPETFTKSTPTYFQDENGNYIYGFCEGNDGQDLYDAVQGAIDAAKAEGADLVIALGHCGTDTQSSPWMSTEIIANTTGLDAFIDGHSHSVIPGQMVQDKDGNDVVLTSTGTKLANIGKMTITPAGEITTELVTGYAEVDPDTDAFIKQIQAQYEDDLNEVVAQSDVDLIVNDPETGDRLVRNSETNLGDLCADAYRTVLGADIAFVNGGGVRADIQAGEITFAEVIAVHPFGNAACVVEATGQEILDALEMASRSAPGENGGFLQVSGLKYTVDLNIPSSVTVDDKSMFVSVDGLRRVKDVQVLNGDGVYEPIDVEKTYTLASHNYMLKSGGDGINMFMDNKLLQDEVMIDNQVLITYIRDYLHGVVGDEYANPYGEGRITVTDMPYTDVPGGTYYYDAVKFVDGQGYMDGVGNSRFAPLSQLTRAMAVTVLHRLEGKPQVTNDNPFPDVPSGAYYENAVNWAVSAGVVEGYEDNTFRPNQKITREEMVAIFYRYAQFKGYDVSATSDLSAFKDGSAVQPYAQAAMEWAVNVGLIIGTDVGTLVPRGLTKRCDFAMVVERFCNAKVDINLMATSDVHGQLFATDYTADASASGTYYQAMTRIASFVKAQRELYENTFLVDCGDLVQGTPLTYYYAFEQGDVDDPAMKALRMMGYDMFVPGNHEFNYGMTILQRQLNYLTSAPTDTESMVAVGCANYLDASKQVEGQPTDWTTWNNYAPYMLYEYDGVTVAVMGIGNPNVPKWDVPANWEGIYFANVIDTYKHYEEEMTQRADLIVVASHSGIDSDDESDFIRRLVSETDTIDLVFTGHEHRNGVTMIANAQNQEIPVFSLSTKCAVVGQAIISYDKISGEYTITTENVPMAQRDENRQWQPLYDVDAELEAALQPYETATWQDYMLQPIGTASGDFPATNLGGAPSAFVELVNKVQIWGAYDRTGENTPDNPDDDTPAQLSITAPLTSGSAENLIPEGDIMLGDMFKLYRYENWFYQITMTGKEVDTWLEYSASKVQLNEDGTVNILGGLTYYDVINGEGFYYEIDPTQPEGDRVTISYNGEPVADDTVFTVVINNYRYNGGGNYVQYLNEHGCEFEANDPDRIIYSTQYDMIQGEDKGQARNLLADYIREAGTINPDITYQWKILGAN